jgi:hypothetical protein
MDNLKKKKKKKKVSLPSEQDGSSIYNFTSEGLGFRALVRLLYWQKSLA